MNYALICGMSVGLLVAGCSKFQLPDIIDVPPVVSSGNNTVDQINSVVQQVRDGAAKYCGLVPTFETAANIIATFTGGQPVVAIVGQVVEGFCKAATSKSARRGGRPVYRGVVLHYTKA